MFEGCTGLTNIPDGLLPCFINTVNNKNSIACYRSMFKGCTGLTSIPENLLPMKDLYSAWHCYESMFKDCTGLTNIPENLLPATSLGEFAYYSMFENCSNIVNSPIIQVPQTYEFYQSLGRMFYNCTKLQKITYYCQDLDGDRNVSWVYGVSSTGKFIYTYKYLNLERGHNGVPEGWEVIYKDSTTN